MNQKLTDKQKTIIAGIIAAKTRVSLDQEAIRDDTAALAIELGMKPSDVSAMITIIIADQNKGGVIETKGRILDLAVQAAGIDNDQESLPLEEGKQDENDRPLMQLDGEDPLYAEAKRITLESGRASVAHIQRVLKIGYNRAARFMEQMALEGIVAYHEGSGLYALKGQDAQA